MLFAPRVLSQLVWLQTELDRSRRVDRFLLAGLAGMLHGNADRAGVPRGLAYKIGLLMGSAINVLRDALPQKHEAAASRSKNLAWALLHQAVRNNGQYRNWVEAYGSSLTKDATFREVIGVQMRNKVAPLIKK